MSASGSDKELPEDEETILGKLGDILIGKNISKFVDAFTVSLNPVLDRVVKVEEAITKIGRDLADFKLSVMKEIVMLRDQLRMLNEALINLEGRIIDYTEGREREAIREEREHEEEWILEENRREELQGGGDLHVKIEKQIENVPANQEETVKIEEFSEAEVRAEKPVLMEEAGVSYSDAVKVAEHATVSVENIEKMKELVRLETRLVKLKGEISSLQSLIEVGLATVADKEALNAKLKEKKEIEEKIRRLREGA